MNEFIDSWKNPHVSKQQLALNRRELSSPNYYPKHWRHFLDTLAILSKEGVDRVVDVGCGVGAYCALSQRHFPKLEYLGYDYSSAAIMLAKEAWKGDFVCCDYQDLKSEQFRKKDVLVSNALCDVLPNGDDCFSYLLSLNVPKLVIQRIKLTDDPSFHKVYNAYGVNTYAFYHNREGILGTIKKHGYYYNEEMEGNFLLSKI